MPHEHSTVLSRSPRHRPPEVLAAGVFLNAWWSDRTTTNTVVLVFVAVVLLAGMLIAFFSLR